MFFFDTDVKIILNCNFLYSNVKNLRSFGKSTFGWGGWIRTNEWRNQNPLPYHLATPQLRN